jgi:hypothetical protein
LLLLINVTNWPLSLFLYILLYWLWLCII